MLKKILTVLHPASPSHSPLAMADQVGSSGHQPYPLAIGGPQGPSLALAPYGPQGTALANLPFHSHQTAVPQGLSAAVDLTQPAGAAAEIQEFVVSAEQDGRRITQTHRVSRARLPHEAQSAEDRCNMLQNEIRSIVRIANDREDWWNSSVSNLTAHTSSQLEQRDALLQSAMARWNNEGDNLRRSAEFATEQARFFKSEAQAVAADQSEFIGAAIGEARASANEANVLRSQLTAAVQRAECMEWEQAGTLEEATVNAKRIQAMSEAGLRLEAQSKMTSKEVEELRKEIYHRQSQIEEGDRRAEGLIFQISKATAERDSALKTAADLRLEVGQQRNEIDQLKSQLADWEDYHQQYAGQGVNADWIDQEAALPAFNMEQPLGAQCFNIGDDEVLDWAPKPPSIPVRTPPQRSTTPAAATAKAASPAVASAKAASLAPPVF